MYSQPLLAVPTAQQRAARPAAGCRRAERAPRLGDRRARPVAVPKLGSRAPEPVRRATKPFESTVAGLQSSWLRSPRPPVSTGRSWRVDRDARDSDRGAAVVAGRGLRVARCPKSVTSDAFRCRSCGRRSPSALNRITAGRARAAGPGSRMVGSGRGGAGERGSRPCESTATSARTKLIPGGRGDGDGAAAAEARGRACRWRGTRHDLGCCRRRRFCRRAPAPSPGDRR